MARCYSLVRFFTEMQRPDAWLFSGIPVAQIISVTAFVVCSIWLLYRHTGPAARAPAPTTRRTRATAAKYSASKSPAPSELKPETKVEGEK